MAYADEYTLARDASFWHRVQMAMVSAAVDIQSEADTATNHARRSAYAKLALNDPETVAQVMAYGVADGSGISSSSSDADLKSRVSAIWNAYAGVV
jgi:hypothetical protein